MIRPMTGEGVPLSHTKYGWVRTWVLYYIFRGNIHLHWYRRNNYLLLGGLWDGYRLVSVNELTRAFPDEAT
jgi:hypothetical protein